MVELAMRIELRYWCMLHVAVTGHIATTACCCRSLNLIYDGNDCNHVHDKSFLSYLVLCLLPFIVISRWICFVFILNQCKVSLDYLQLVLYYRYYCFVCVN